MICKWCQGEVKSDDLQVINKDMKFHYGCFDDMQDTNDGMIDWKSARNVRDAAQSSTMERPLQTWEERWLEDIVTDVLSFNTETSQGNIREDENS